jgi:hypothetical protein
MRSTNKRSRSKTNRPKSLGNIVNRVFDSSGPEGKVRGTPQQIIEKYQVLARDAQLSNDRVAAENFQQHAEHYTRMLAQAQREMQAEQEARKQQQDDRNRQHDERNRAHGDDRNRNGHSDDRGQQSSRRHDNRRQNDENGQHSQSSGIAGGNGEGFLMRVAAIRCALARPRPALENLPRTKPRGSWCDLWGKCADGWGDGCVRGSVESAHDG